MRKLLFWFFLFFSIGAAFLAVGLWFASQIASQIN